MHSHWIVHIDILIAIYITLDFSARLFIAENRWAFFRKFHNIADVFVVITLVAPLLFQNLTFLRILRVIRILRAFTFLRRFPKIASVIDQHRRVIDNVMNFLTFLFIMSAFVYIDQVGKPDSDISSPLDALYFTVTSLTTTGYGDILLKGPMGKILAIIVMILGLTLFIQMLQSIISDDEQRIHSCEACGLDRHDRDAVHCKRCGALLKLIPTTSS